MANLNLEKLNFKEVILVNSLKSLDLDNTKMKGLIL
jgi:hypothetical protein